MVRKYIYKGRIAKVSPPDVALAVATVSSVSVPVLIFLSNLFKDSDHRELEKSEWIQDHLSAGDIVEFEFEKIQKRSAHRKYNVATFAWKTEQDMRQQACQQKVQSNSSSYSEVKMRCSGDADDKPVSDAGASEVTSSIVSHVSTSDVDSCSETNDTTPVTAETEIRVEHDTNENKCASTSEASEHVRDGASEQLMKCGISPLEWSMSVSNDAYITSASLDKSQDSNVRTVTSYSEEYTRHDTPHKLAHELARHSPGKLEWPGGVDPPDIPERGGGIGLSRISKLGGGVVQPDLSEQGGVVRPDLSGQYGVVQPDLSQQDGGVVQPNVSEQDRVVQPDLSQRDGRVVQPDLSEQDRVLQPDLSEQDGGIVQPDLSEQGGGVGPLHISKQD
jgi:hypothetical protein